MNSNAVEIVPAKPADVDLVLGILNEATSWLQEHNLPDAWRKIGFSRQAFLDQIAREEVHLAKVDQKPAGTITLQWSDTFFWGERPPDSGYVHKLAISPAYAGHGIGLRMLRWAEAASRAAGKKYLRLNCLAENRKIRDYYERAGFLYRGEVVGILARASLYEKPL